MPAQEGSQLSLGDLLQAIEATAADLAAMTEQVATLEAANYRLEEEGNELNVQVTEMEIRLEGANAALRAATHRADQAEAGAAAYLSHADRLEADLTAANDDITSITAAISDLVAQRQLRRVRRETSAGVG